LIHVLSFYFAWQPKKHIKKQSIYNDKWYFSPVAP